MEYGSRSLEIAFGEAVECKGLEPYIATDLVTRATLYATSFTPDTEFLKKFVPFPLFIQPIGRWTQEDECAYAVAVAHPSEMDALGSILVALARKEFRKAHDLASSYTPPADEMLQV